MVTGNWTRKGVIKKVTREELEKAKNKKDNRKVIKKKI